MLRKTIQAQGWQSVGWLNVNIRTLRVALATPLLYVFTLSGRLRETIGV